MNENPKIPTISEELIRYLDNLFPDKCADLKDTEKEGSGVVAQELQKVAPELVTETNGTLGVSYGNITGYLIEAIKDLKAEIEELKKHKCNDCTK